MNFAVVMTVYKGTQVSQLDVAMRSILASSILPNEILLVVDGPVDGKLSEAVNAFSKQPLIEAIELDENQGPGVARDHGIKRTTSPLIAIMDSDDICEKYRFEKQLEVFKTKSIDVVGGVIEEFKYEIGDTKFHRNVPISHIDIVANGWLRFPMNNVTLMYKRQAYEKAGGYGVLRQLEDWDLFYRLVLSGAKFENLPNTLVYVRCDDEFLKRRHGLKILKSELIVFWRMYQANYTTLSKCMLAMCSRLVIRLSPKSITGLAYSKLRSP